MHYYFITGTSSGIGHALTLQILEQKNTFVTGFSRRCTIEDERYKHITVNLSNLNDVKQITFETGNDAESVTLINNAGQLGDLTFVGKQNPDEIIHTYNVNIIAPSILSNTFMKTFWDTKTQKVILNVSSGAGRHTIESWSTYCSSKAAMDMLSKVINEEQNIAGLPYPFYIFSLAPGIIDTAMQTYIRSVGQENFPDISRFIKLKENNLLDSPDDAAKRILRIVSNPKKYQNVILDESV